MTFYKFSLNGNVKPISQAKVSVLNIEYAYGFGVYETIRVNQKIPYFVTNHTERLMLSAKIIGLKHSFNPTLINQYIKDLIAQTAEDVYNLKIMLIGGKNKTDALLYIFPSAPLFPLRNLYRAGAKVITFHYERPFPNAKTLSMLPSYLAYKKARAKHCYEALAIDRNGYITEGTMSNFFLVKDQVIFTPAKDRILAGVTKEIVLYLAAQNGMKIQSKNVSLAEIADYDGSFMTSTSSKVMPIIRIDDYSFPKIPGLVFRLNKLYDNYLKTCSGKFTKND